jgi:glyoxylase-like metal-dependent hydrolase (beta-lactamase superfamily II)
MEVKEVPVHTAVSGGELDAQRGGRLPAPEEIRPGVWTVPLEMPIGVAPVSFAYLIVDGRGSGHLIDPGWSTPANALRLREAYARAGIHETDIRTVLSTHLHTDHLGAADDIRMPSGARLIMHELEQRDLHALLDNASDTRQAYDDIARWGVPSPQREELMSFAGQPSHYTRVDADALVAHGDVISLGDRELQVLHTPGHTRGHICLAMPGENLLFTGDHVLPRIVPGLGLGARGTANALDEYVATATVLAPFDEFEICPGHGYRFTGLLERMEEIFDRHGARAAEISAILLARPNASVWDVARSVTWTAGWNRLHTFLLISALSQTELIANSRFRWERPRGGSLRQDPVGSDAG